jgi:ribose transport system permease protein
MTPLDSSPPVPSAETAGPPEDDRALPAASRLAVWLKTRAAWIFLFDVALVVLFSITTPHHVYATTANVTNVLLALTEALLLGLGLTMLLGAGIFDLSLGANLVLSSVVGAKVMLLFAPGSSTALAIAAGAAACLATGLVYGLVNGLIIGFLGINSLIATLATLGIGTGIADLLTGGTDLGGLPAQLQTDIGLNKLGAVPLPSLVALAALVILWLVVRYTRYGLRVQAIGSSRAAAERAGLRVRSYLISLTVLAGGLAGIGGFIDLTRFGSTSLAGHPNDALNAVTAAVIGGTLLEGGFISVIGTLWGACLAVILETGLVISGVSAFWQLIVVGIVLLVAVALDRITVRRRARARH